MPYFVRTLKCEPGRQLGAVVDRTPYTTLGEARTVRDRCIAEEATARANGERDRVWYLFDIQDIRPERPVVGGGDVGGPGIRARAWARRARKEAGLALDGEASDG